MADSPRLEELRRRVQADPASIAFAALAEEYRRAGKFREAVDASRAGLRYHPTYVSARVTLGRSLMELQESEQAERELTFVLKSAPDNLAARRALGELCWQQLRFADALTHFRTAQTLAPADTELPNILQSLERELAADRAAHSKANGKAAEPVEPPVEAPAAVEAAAPVVAESVPPEPAAEVVAPAVEAVAFAESAAEDVVEVEAVAFAESAAEEVVAVAQQAEEVEAVAFVDDTPESESHDQPVVSEVIASEVIASAAPVAEAEPEAAPAQPPQPTADDRLIWMLEQFHSALLEEQRDRRAGVSASTAAEEAAASESTLPTHAATSGRSA
jgi:hypothetical protein